MEKLEGLIAAPFTPFDEKGEVNYGQIPVYYSFLKRNNVKGAFINGTTGETASLSQKERQKTAESWVLSAKENPGVKIINLAGGTSLPECIENAQHSAAIGIDAIALLAPYYFKAPDISHLVEFCAQIAESVPRMPVYYYHIPDFTGSPFSMAEFLKKAAPVIPNLAGIKYSHVDFMDYQACVAFRDGKYDMLWGYDEYLLLAMMLGARGAVGSTYNYAAPLYNKLIDAFKNGETEQARQLQVKAIEMIRLLDKYGGIATGKAFMRYINLDCGKFRLPVKNINEEDYLKFVEDVRALDIEEYFSEY